jgi:N-glycosylase/DNA lyase
VRDVVLSKAIEFCGGIRVLRQPRWETLCSYIISQNNNIPRIKSLINKMCTSFGNIIKIKRPDGTLDEDYSFPEAKALSALDVPSLEKLGFGYRANYVLSAAQALVSEKINLDSIAEMPINEGRTELRKLVGVGPKVAECSLLYGFGRIEAFPVDTWIKAVMTEFYPGGLPEFVKPYAGIAQIYLFHYVRNRDKI